MLPEGEAAAAWLSERDGGVCIDRARDAADRLRATRAAIWVFTVGVHSGYREKFLPPGGGQTTNQLDIGVGVSIWHYPLVER